MSDDDIVDGLLRAADRAPFGIDASVSTLDQIGLLARSGARDPERRVGGRRTVVRRGVAIGSVLGVLVVGGAAAAVKLLTSTKVGTAGFCQTERQATASIPFPADDQAWRNWALLTSVGPKVGTTLRELCTAPASAHLADGGRGYVIEPARIEQGQFLQSAFCAWTDKWLLAERQGDATRASRAGGEIAGALKWPVSRLVDPHPVAGYYGTRLGWFLPVQKEVASHAALVVAQLFLPLTLPDTHGYLQGRCTFYKPPAVTDGGTLVTAHPFGVIHPAKR